MPAAMDRKFERRLMLAQNPRARKRNAKAKKKFVRRSNVANALDEMTRGGDGRIFDPNPHRMACNGVGAALAPALVSAQLAIAAVQDVAAAGRRMGKKERMRKLEKRRKYYAAEAAKREERRKQIRAATAEPKNPCPTAEALAEAYRRRRESEEWQLRFGRLMIDLEEHARRRYAIAGNKFTGSSGGVKEWLKEKCPLLAAHYSTCQRYKRLAQDYDT